MTYYYNKTDTCDRCDNRFHGKACREYDEKGNWNGKWLCNTCYQKDYHKRPYSHVR